MSDKKLYHTITFDDGARYWGYPLPHLLDMHRQEQLPKSAEIESRIELIFSSEKIVVLGKKLEKLWEKLVMQQDLEIKLGWNDAGYFVQSIKHDNT